SEPESEEVIKNTNTRTTAMIDNMLPNGSTSNIWNIASDTSVRPFAPNSPTLLTT
ncbi:hypothetical protein D044_2434B, partial [Vibrio parahaemolyticus EKP-026]